MHYANMTYIWYSICAALALILFYIWAMKRRKALLNRFADKKLVSGIAPSFSMQKKVLKMAMITAAASLALFSLARPQWGFEWEEVKRSGLDILIAIDVSKSMLAKDVKPNRLERSKFAVKDLVRKLNGDRVGLIAFAGTAFLQCPLTIDYNGFLLALDDLSTSTIPRGGTDIASAIKEAMSSLSGADKRYKVLVLITDGENLEGDALKAAAEAAKDGIKIYCVGVGTAEGDLIPLIDEYGNRAYVADREGNAIKTRLDEETLKQVAISTGGNYVKATQAEFGLTLLYDKSLSKLEKRDIESKMRKHYQERFQVFLAIAAALLFLEPLIRERRRTA